MKGNFEKMRRHPQAGREKKKGTSDKVLRYQTHKEFQNLHTKKMSNPIRN